MELLKKLPICSIDPINHPIAVEFNMHLLKHHLILRKEPCGAQRQNTTVLMRKKNFKHEEMFMCNYEKFR